MVYYVYIMTNKQTGTLYIGVTDDIKRRVYEHKNKTFEGFTKRYNLQKLVYYEEIISADTASQREKTMKQWLRKWKLDLINKHNPEWRDLSMDWIDYAEEMGWYE